MHGSFHACSPVYRPQCRLVDTELTDLVEYKEGLAYPVTYYFEVCELIGFEINTLRNNRVGLPSDLLFRSVLISKPINSATVSSRSKFSFIIILAISRYALHWNYIIETSA